MQAPFLTLASDNQVIAASPRGCAVGAIQGNRLASLQNSAGIDTPASKDSACHRTAVRQEALALPEGELVASAQVKDVPNIERSQAVVVFDPGSHNVRSPEALQTPAIQQVARIGARFGISVGSQEIQATAKLFFHLALKSMIVAITVRGRVARSLPEIREGKAAQRCGDAATSGVAINLHAIQAAGKAAAGAVGELCARGLNLRDVVRVGEGFQVPRQRSHVASLNAQSRSKLILNGEVAGHRIRRGVVKLNSAQR